MGEKIETHQMAGLPLAKLGQTQATELIIDWASQADSRGMAVHFVTAHTIYLAERDSKLRQLLKSGDLLLADSRWLQIFSGLGRTKLAQVRGPDFFRDVLRLGCNVETPHFFVGPSDQVNRALETGLKALFPSLRTVGFTVGPYPPFSSSSLGELVAEIPISVRPIVWVGVGTPAQNYLIHALARETGLVVVGVGAAFDFLSGVKREAPPWVSRIGFEWLFRLFTEPRRLWKRYLVGNVVFVYALMKYKLTGSFMGAGKGESGVR